jgi:hypothetical protein
MHVSHRYEEKADILRSRQTLQELKQAFRFYTKALSLLGAEASRSPHVLYKKTLVGMLLREHKQALMSDSTEEKTAAEERSGWTSSDDEKEESELKADEPQEGYRDIYMDFMTCLGMLKKLEEAGTEKTMVTLQSLKLASKRGNADDDAKSSVEEEVRQRALLRADIEESVGVLFCNHMPDKVPRIACDHAHGHTNILACHCFKKGRAEMCTGIIYQLNNAPLSLLEALRIKIRWLGAKSFETFHHLDKVLLQLAQQEGYAAIKHR